MIVPFKIPAFSEPPVTGPVRKELKRSTFDRAFFSKQDQERIDLADQEMKAGKQFSIDTLTGLVGWMCAKYVCVYQGDPDEDDRVHYGYFEHQILLADVMVTIVGTEFGFGIVYHNTRLPSGEFTYQSIIFENLDMGGRLNAVTHHYTNSILVGRLGMDPDVKYIPEQYVSTGVTHHAYKNGHPINSTNNGYTKRAAREVDRYTLHGIYRNSIQEIHSFYHKLLERVEKDKLIEQLIEK